MLGWMLIFALMVLCGAIAAVGIGPAPGLTSSLVFGVLLVISALSLFLRGRA